MLIRHGARSPALVTDAFREIGIKYAKQLTKRGKRQQFELGREVREYYMFSDYGARVQFSSSFKKRCIESMNHFGKGFGVDLDENADYEILPRHFFHKHQLHMFSGAQIVDFDLRFRSQTSQLLQRANELGWPRVRAHYCPSCLDSEVPSLMVRSMKKVSTIIACHEANSIGTMAVPEQLRDVLDTAFRLHYYSLSLVNRRRASDYSVSVLKVIGKSILIYLRKHRVREELVREYAHLMDFEARAKSTTLMWAHDRNIIAFLKLFKKSKTLVRKQFYKPDFAAFIKVELVQAFASTDEINQYFFAYFRGVRLKGRKGDMFVRVLYMQKELRVGKCEKGQVKLDCFFKFINY
jgi:hypothetical protein